MKNTIRYSSNHGKWQLRLSAEAGLTLIELMVAMVIGLLVVLAAAAALIMSRQGFSALDASAQLRDNSRFAADFIQRLALQAGYVDASNMNPRGTFLNNANSPPPISGFDNAVPGAWSGDDTSKKSDCATGKPCGDVLILSNQISPDVPGKGASPSMVGSQAMLNCFGASPDPNDSALYSAFYLGTGDSGETALMCKYREKGKDTWKQQPLVQGVESLQVLYGVNGVEPGVKSAPATLDPAESVPTRYLRADELTVAGNLADTQNNWRRVRSLRIGMVLRAPLQSATAPRTDPLFPLGEELANEADVGSEVLPAAINDTRLRTVVTFTVQLRNYQGQL